MNSEENEPPPELLAMAQSGLPALAFGWLNALRRTDADEVWRLNDPQFRQALTQMWIWHNRTALLADFGTSFDRDELAVQLAKEAPAHPLWEPCARVSLRTLRQACGEILDEELGLGSQPRMLGPDLELVCFTPVGDLPQDEQGVAWTVPGSMTRSLSLVVKHHDGFWRVAGIGHHILQPGWPPSHVQIATPED